MNMNMSGAISRLIIDRGSTRSILSGPGGYLFHRRYGIASSWDEFGVPSTFAAWVPEPFVRQVLYEQTGNRELAEHVVIRNFADREEWTRARGDARTGRGMVVDVENILR